MRHGAAALAALAAPAPCGGHGQLNYPPSTRQGLPGQTWPGALTGRGAGGYCEQPNSENPRNRLNGACMLFSQPNSKQPLAAIIPGEPTNNDAATRTTNRFVSGGADDWTRRMPWRAPGAAPVLGSGCGVAGGGVKFNNNGGWPPTGMTQGEDPLTRLPKSTSPTVWKAGSVVEVAWGVWANHGGGYSYRLCRNIAGTMLTEQCFQNTQLRFAGTVQWLQHINGSRYEIPRVTLSKGTFPAGSEWARIPIPACVDGGSPPNRGFGDICSTFQFPEPIPGMHGFGHNNNTHVMDTFHDYSIVDKVVIPAGLDDGEYYLSWRWDCEQTPQVWNSCADVVVG